VTWAIEQKSYSQRRACGLVGLAPKTYRYRSRRPDDAGLRHRLRELALERLRFGYRRLLILLRREGLTLNHKRLFRLYRDERLTVRKRGGRKRALGTRAAMALPHEPNQRWSLSGRRVARELDRIVELGGQPLQIVSDNGDGADLARAPLLAGGARGRVALHRARQTDAKRLGREPDRPTARRMPERAPVLEPASRQADDRTLADRLQHPAAAHEPPRAHPVRLYQPVRHGPQPRPTLAMIEGTAGGKVSRVSPSRD
jgi:hypothetical protein